MTWGPNLRQARKSQSARAHWPISVLARSAMASTVAWVLAPGTVGITEASATRSLSMPHTRSCGSTTAAGSVQIGHYVDANGRRCSAGPIPDSISSWADPIEPALRIVSPSG